MITRERLERSAYGRGLLVLMSRLVPYKVTDWGNDDSDDKDSNRPGDRERAVSLNNANVVTSLIDTDGWSPSGGRHHLLLDIDHPSWLMPSTTPGHYHLYVEVPNGMSAADLDGVLDALAIAGVIEAGYAGASKARGFTSVRLPWIEKEKGVKQHD